MGNAQSLNVKVGIVDDKAINIKLLQDMLGRLFPQLEIVGTAASVKTGLQLIQDKKPDLVFLDIDMGDGYGFDIVQRSEYKGFQVIFVTAFPSYALSAWNYRALHYLVKPVAEEDLIEAVQRYLTRVNGEGSDKQFFNMPSYGKSSSKRICLPDQERLLFVEVQDIIYCEVSGSYTVFRMPNQNKHVVSKSLNTYEKLLEEDGFFRIHDKYLVNLAHIAAYIRGRGGEVVLNTGEQLPVSVRKRDAFLKRMQSL
ncbi:MAG: LytTR family DNA-binding domain-containing protein [Bacteroidota bacterium]